jgi:hypothetical protein
MPPLELSLFGKSMPCGRRSRPAEMSRESIWAHCQHGQALDLAEHGQRGAGRRVGEVKEVRVRGPGPHQQVLLGVQVPPAAAELLRALDLEPAGRGAAHLPGRHDVPDVILGSGLALGDHVRFAADEELDGEDAHPLGTRRRAAEERGDELLKLRVLGRLAGLAVRVDVGDEHGRLGQRGGVPIGRKAQFGRNVHLPPRLELPIEVADALPAGRRVVLQLDRRRCCDQRAERRDLLERLRGVPGDDLLGRCGGG